jgi:signal transduction histidine kinase
MNDSVNPDDEQRWRAQEERADDPHDEPDFPALAELASCVCLTRFAVICDREGAVLGTHGPWAPAPGLPLEAFRSRVGDGVQLVTVVDTWGDAPLANHPWVRGEPYLRFFAGRGLTAGDGTSIGSLCVFDDAPRQLSAAQLRALDLVSRSTLVHLAASRRATDMQRLHRSLRSSNEHLTTFMRAASHDLRGPLRTIMLMAEAVQSTSQLDERSTRFIAGIHEAARRARRLVDDLLTHARVDAGEQRGRVDLARAVTDACADLKDLIELTRAKIAVDQLPSIQGSSTAWMVILKNLIENAIKYTPRERIPEVRIVGVEDDGALVSVQVEDNGCGIEPTSAHRIFEPLVRLHSSDVPGSGIGLATVLKLVTQMGGSVDVRTRTQGGSVFTVTVPRSP